MDNISLKRIQVLPLHVASQIAAGEVVERPASVVKELLENSLDADAKVIEIDVQKGGAHLISIRDDGHGIAKDDLSLAITPHATSKITVLHDLVDLSSLGFRGEALASISSVAQFSLISKQHQSKVAWRLNIEGERPSLLPAAHPQGTTIEVRNLFYNTPVRRKFLKAERTEFQHIEDVVKRIALSAYDVSFVLQHNKRQIMRIPPAKDKHSVKQRLHKILGRQFIDVALEIDIERSGLCLQGWILPAEYGRAHADQQYFFVNGRIVKDRLLNHAVRSAFAETMQPGRYPGYVLYLRCNPAEVDINVHPTKHEVRFQQTRLVHDFICFGLQQLLQPKHNEDINKTDKLAVSTPIHQNSLDDNIAEKGTGYTTFVRDKVDVFSQALELVANHFIVACASTDLFLIDALKAQRWLQHKKLSELLQYQTLRAQPLLLPVTIRCTPTQLQSLLEKEELWQDFAIGLQQVGPDAIMLRTVPECLRNVDADTLLKAMYQIGNKEEMLGCVVWYSVNVKPLLLTEMQAIINDLSVFPLVQLQQEKLVRYFSYNELKKLFI